METLIAITIFTLIAVIMAVTVKLCLRSVEKGDKKVESIQRLRAAVRIIESQTQSFVPMTYSDNGTTKKLYLFKGRSDEFVFVSNVSAWGRDRGVVAVKYAVDHDGDLTVTEWDMLKATKRSTVLLKNAKNMKFNFTVKRPEDIDSKTETDVDKTDYLPQFVQIKSPLFEGDINVPIMANNILQSSTTSASSTSLSKAVLFDPAIFQ